ncbi:unnamed protein product [Tuber melanosporum]|uniref:(Perigord truffle) hypothetical protein n=1 Tax=Tuber melanosporum (strain Mel28) TaxID=656061 RepID=D5GAR4_TUBMM|nr:uncharacterized protein GSTUM_00003751001 [Tuber melanosporum]CAZ81607.1 unnamed protein product [Tuber melanosporum]
MAGSNKLKLAIVLLTVSAFLYKAITQRSPLYLLAPPFPLPPSISSSCSKNFPELLRNCEDFSILPNTTLLFLSCDRSRREWYHAFRAFPPDVPKGEIFIWDYDKPEVEPTLLSGAESLDDDFHPLGVSAVPREEGGEVRLFVTNQAKKEARIEVLDVDLETRTARHKRSLTDAKIFSPNGIVGVDENSFFITNDGFFSRRWSTALLFEVILGAPGGQVVHVSIPPLASATGKDSVDAYSVAWISLANGLALDHVKQKLYVASSTHGVYTYSIPDMSRPYLTVPESFHRTPFATDNLHLGPTSRLFASGITSLGDFATSMLSEGIVGPAAWTAELLPRVDPSDKREAALRALDPANSPLRKEEWVWRSVYLDDGKFFGGVSTGGIVDMQGTFVGVSVVGKGVLVCKRVIERPGVLVGEENVKEEL